MSTITYGSATDRNIQWINDFALGLPSVKAQEFVIQHAMDVQRELEARQFNFTNAEIKRYGFENIAQMGVYAFLAKDYGDVRDVLSESSDVIEDIMFMIENFNEETEEDAMGELLRHIVLGGAFRGLKQIEEYEDENIFIPSTGKCAVKVLQRFIDLNFTDSNYKVECATFDVKTDGLKAMIRDAATALNAKQEDFPKIYKLSDGKIARLDKDGTAVKTCAILCVPLFDHIKKSKYHHAILIKNLKRTYISIDDLKHTYEKYASKVVPVSVTTLSNTCRAQHKKTFTKKEQMHWAYDFETLTNSSKFQEPIGVSYMQFDPSKSQDEIKEENVLHDVGYGCYDRFIVDIARIAKESDCKTVNLWAHNGGKFDAFIIECRSKVLKFENNLRAGGSIKMLVAKYEDITFNFKDSYSFISAGLKSACNDFACKYKKMDFDIVNKDEEFYTKTTEWIKYMDYDVLSLSCLIVQFNAVLMSLNASIDNYNSAAGFSFQYLISNSAAEFNKVMRHTNPVTIDFIKRSQYGGRVLCWKHEYNNEEDPLVSIDANSLYPAAMAKFDYPYGNPLVTNDEMTFDKFSSEVGDKLYIAEIEFTIPNVRFAIIPYRPDDGNCIIYPSNGTYRGVYTSIDITEMELEGYTINKVFHSVIYPQKCNMFGKVINHIYNERNKAKEAGNGCLEKVLKLIMNSSYGKFSERSNTTVSYAAKTDPDKKLQSKTTLNNGQIRKVYNEEDSYRNPLQIGSFILSYARAIMNRIFRKVPRDRIYYSDTDSVYMPLSEWNKLGKFNNDLGGFKNDYSDGVGIKSAIFLDLKRYFLELNKPYKGSNFTCKFVGLCFRNYECIMDWANEGIIDSKQKINKTEACRKFYTQLLEEYSAKKDLTDKRKKKGEQSGIKILQNKWKREIGGGVIIDDLDIEYEINPHKRGQWKGNSFYSLGFDRDEPEYIHEFVDWDYGRTESRGYIIRKAGIEMNHPISFQNKTINAELTNLMMCDGSIYMLRDGYFFEYTPHGISGLRVEDPRKEGSNWFYLLAYGHNQYSCELNVFDTRHALRVAINRVNTEIN